MKRLIIFLSVLSLALFAAGIGIILATQHSRALPAPDTPAVEYIPEEKNQCLVMSNEEFAGVAIMVLDIAVPQGAARLSEDEIFKARAGLLADIGIEYFIDADRQAPVVRGELCNVLKDLNDTVVQAANKPSDRSNPTFPHYDPIKGYVQSSPSELTDYVKQFGCVTGTLAEDTACANEIITALSNPEYSSAVAEVYSSPKE